MFKGAPIFGQFCFPIDSMIKYKEILTFQFTFLADSELFFTVNHPLKRYYVALHCHVMVVGVSGRPGSGFLYSHDSNRLLHRALFFVFVCACLSGDSALIALC